MLYEAGRFLLISKISCDTLICNASILVLFAVIFALAIGNCRVQINRVPI